MEDNQGQISATGGPTGWWERLRYKYRVSLMNEDTLAESWHVRISKLGLITILTLMFFLTLIILAILILCTPIRNVLPGYSESIRQQLIEQSVEVDSMRTHMTLQDGYLRVVKQVIAGEVEQDSVQSLDSLQIIMRAQLLEAKNEATEEFLAQYEAKDKDNLQLFDIQQNVPVLTFFKPVNGIVVEPYEPNDGRFGVVIQTQGGEHVVAVLAGTIVYHNYEIDNTYTLVLHHATYISIYRGLGVVLKKTGDTVEAGDVIALTKDATLTEYELWQNDRSVNPQSVIAF